MGCGRGKKTPFFSASLVIAFCFLCLAAFPGFAGAGSVVVQNGQLVTSSLDVGVGALFVNSTFGFVGIGNSTGAAGPARPLHISAIQDANIRLQDTSGAGPSAYIEFFNDTSRWGYMGMGGHDDKMVLGTTAEKNLSFYTNDSPKMVLTAEGNVGIGADSPGYRLDVNGTVNAYSFLINGSPLSTSQWAANGSNTYLAAGNVGIGTESPGSTLEVNGSFSVNRLGSRCNIVGGAVTVANGYRIHTFTSNGTLTVPCATAVEYLVVAGGGAGGGQYWSGGGGAGGFLNGSMNVSGVINVVVGAGGVGSLSSETGKQGGDSSFGSIVAVGGGGGGAASSTSGGNGGSGGGGSIYAACPAGSGVAGQGNNGARGSGYPNFNDGDGGGGGGAGSAGIAGNATAVPNASSGGAGLLSSISGTPQYYAGGGGGSLFGSQLRIGGSGVGGNGAGASDNPAAGDGVNGTGSGGGGAYNRYNTGKGGDGGSGIVIVRYPDVSDVYTSSLTVNYSTGNVGIGLGTTIPGYTLTVAGTAWVTSGSWSGSDARWKRNVTSLSPSSLLEKALALRPVNFEWRDDTGTSFPNGTQVGFIAQEVEKIVPEVVTTDNAGYKGMSYERITPILTGAIQEQQRQIAVLKAIVCADHPQVQGCR